MSLLIKKIGERHTVWFDKGCFDNWCVYLHREGTARYAPRDTEYFSRLQQLGATHGHQKIYEDFTRCYALTHAQIDPVVLHLITQLSAGYGTDAEELDIWLTVLYGGMIAEENKAGALLKKRIKRLGMHQLLIEGMDAPAAASFSKGKSWRALDVLMKERGF